MKEVSKSGIKIIALNRKASFNYFLSDFLECGIVLKGTEIKSLRAKGCTIGDAYIVIRDHELEIINMHISTYDQGNIFNHEPLRNRKLIAHKREILFFENKVKLSGYSIIPTKVYFKKGKCKIEIALGKGKKNYDKRESIKERDLQREMQKEI